MSDAMEQLMRMRQQTGARKAKPAFNLTAQPGRFIPGRGVSDKDITFFARQLAAMVNAGLPILKSLETLAEQGTKNTLGRILDTLCADIRAGYSFYEALQKHQRVFGAFFVSMTEVGETGGVLGPILERVAVYQEKSSTLKRKLRTALAYPALVVGVATAAVGFLMTTVIPTFESLFAGFEADLPGPTRLVIALSGLLKNHVVIILPALAGIAVLGGWILRRPGVRLALDRWILNVPALGPVLRKNAIARFSRSLGSLLTNGIPLINALDITSRTVGNRAFASTVTRMREAVRTGQSLVDPLKASGLFTPMTVQMVTVGEESGTLGNMLSKTAEFYEAEVDASVEMLTALIEPVIIIVLGVVLGAVLIAMYLPMFELMNVIQ